MATIATRHGVERDRTDRARWRAQARHGAVRRRAGLDGHGRAAGPGAVAGDHAALLLDPLGGRPPHRGDRRQIHRRRDHGRLRGADRPRGPHKARLLRGAADARRRLRVRRRAAPQAWAQLLDPDRDQLRRGDRGRDRRRERRQLHGDRAHGRARAADGGAGRARKGLPRRGGGRPRSRLPRPRGPRRVRDQGVEPPGQGLRADRDRQRPLAARPLPRTGLLPVRRAQGRAERAGRRPGGGTGGRGSGHRDRRRSRARKEPPLRRVHRALPGRGDRGLRSAGAGPWPGDAIRAGPPDPARLLRAFRRRLGAGLAREDRRPGAAARSRADRGPADPFRLHGAAGPRAADTAAEPGGPPAGAAQPPLQAPPCPASARRLGQRDRGPALDGRRQRRAARRAAGLGRGDEDARHPQLTGPSTHRVGESCRTTAKSRSSRSGPPTPRACCATWSGTTPPSTVSPS